MVDRRGPVCNNAINTLGVKGSETQFKCEVPSSSKGGMMKHPGYTTTYIQHAGAHIYTEHYEAPRLTLLYIYALTCECTAGVSVIKLLHCITCHKTPRVSDRKKARVQRNGEEE